MTDYRIPQILKEHRDLLKYFEFDGNKIAFLDSGNKKAPVMLLVHGVPTSSFLYRHMAVHFVTKGYRVIAPDLLGYGASDKPQDLSEYVFYKQGKLLNSLLDHLGIEKWNQVVHDAGGLWSWEQLLQRSDGLQQLILLNTIAIPEGFKPPMTFKDDSILGKWYGRLYGYRLTGPQIISMTMKQGSNKKFKQYKKEELDAYYLPFMEGGYRAIQSFFTSFDIIYKNLPGYIENVLKQLNYSPIIIWGMRDKILKGKTQISAIKQMLTVPAENIMTLEEGTHFIQEEKPGEIVDFIHDRLRQ